MVRPRLDAIGTGVRVELEPACPAMRRVCMVDLVTVISCWRRLAPERRYWLEN
jgi:hypothetical protein